MMREVFIGYDTYGRKLTIRPMPPEMEARIGSMVPLVEPVTAATAEKVRALFRSEGWALCRTGGLLCCTNYTATLDAPTKEMP